MSYHELGGFHRFDDSGDLDQHHLEISPDEVSLTKDFVELTSNTPLDEDIFIHFQSNSTSPDRGISPYDDFLSIKPHMGSSSFRRPKGKALSNAIFTDKSFPRLKFRLRKPAIRSPFMSQFENNLLITTNFHYVDEESELIYYSIMALTVFYIKNNAVHWFKYDTPQQNKIKLYLLSAGSNYYGIALSHLRTYLTAENSNVSVSIVVSSLLNKLTIYEFKDSSHSLAFTNGTAGIFNTALQNPNGYNKLEFAWIINYLDIAYKTDFFPSYSYKTLQEFSEYVELYEQNIHHEFDDKLKVVLQLNNLKKFLADFHDITKTHLVSEIRNDYKLVYTVLRNYLRILPDEMFFIKFTRKNVMKYILMLLYEALSKLLESILPNCYHLFFQGFKEGIKLWNVPNYTWVKLENIPDDLERVEQYSIRVSSFFLKRFNILSTFFGDHPYNANPVTNEMISKCMTEVIIERFTGTAVGFVNLVHFPLAAKFLKEDENIVQNLAQIEKFDIFETNLHLYKYIKTDLTSRNQVVEPHPQFMNVDPILNSHLLNTTASLAQPRKMPVQDEFEDWATRVTYYALLEPDLAKRATDWISRDYSRCLSKGLFSIPDEEGKFNYKTGLNHNDQDVILFIRNPIKIFSKTEKLTNTELVNILNQFYKRRNSVFLPSSQEPAVTTPS